MAVIANRKKGGYFAVVYYKKPCCPGCGIRHQIRKNASGKREAEDLERDFLNRRDAGTLPGMVNDPAIRPESATETRALTVSAWFTKWIEAYRADNPESRTPGTYETLVNRYVLPVIGSKALEGLEPDDVRLVIASDPLQALTGTTRLHVYRVLSQGLKAAVWADKLTRNPCDRVKAPKADRFEPYSLTLADGQRLLELSKATEIGPLITVLAYTGLRLGEALGLRWRDVDLDGATLHVNQTRKINAPVQYGEPKTASSKAPVPLVSVVVETLADHREAQRTHYEALHIAPEHDLVFTDGIGRGLAHDGVTWRWKALREDAEVPKARLHDLRHFTGTLLINLGVDVKTVQTILRHSNPMTTLNLYAHNVPQTSRDAVAKLEAAIAAK